MGLLTFISKPMPIELPIFHAYYFFYKQCDKSKVQYFMRIYHKGPKITINFVQKRNIKEKYDSNGDGKIDEDEKNKGSRRIVTEYKKKFKSLRPSSKRTSTRGIRTREEDITNRLKTLKKFKKTLAACSENPRGKGCVSYGNIGCSVSSFGLQNQINF